VAFQFSNPAGRRRRRPVGTLSEINIIPLVDVVMVLLIIFMLTAHVMEFGLEVEVPKVKQVKTTVEEKPVITITREGTMQLNESTVNINDVAAEVERRFPGSRSVYVRADGGVMWNVLAQVVSALNEAKLDIQMVTQPVDETGKGN
jgi:biopolymer transport protein ExbD